MFNVKEMHEGKVSEYISAEETISQKHSMWGIFDDYYSCYCWPMYMFVCFHVFMLSKRSLWLWRIISHDIYCYIMQYSMCVAGDNQCFAPSRPLRHSSQPYNTYKIIGFEFYVKTNKTTKNFEIFAPD